MAAAAPDFELKLIRGLSNEARELLAFMESRADRSGMGSVAVVDLADLIGKILACESNDDEQPCTLPTLMAY